MILFYIYIFGVVIGVILGIVNIKKISENRSNLYYTIRNYTKVGFYFEPSLGLYGEIRWDPDWDGYIKKKSLTGLFIKRAILMPWLSWIYVIKYIFKVVDNIKFDLNKPERLKEIECIINSGELTTDEMLELILEMDYKIHYGKFIYVPILKKRSDNRVFVDDDYCSIKEGQTGILKKNVLFYGKLGKEDNDFYIEGNKLIREEHELFTMKTKTYEYKIEGTKVFTKCIEYEDYYPKSWRPGENYYPIKDGEVDIDSIENEIRGDAEENRGIKGKERERVIKEEVQKDFNKYNGMTQWCELGKTYGDKWIDTYILSQKMDYGEFKHYINGIIKDTNRGAKQIKDLCEEYGTTIKFNKEGECIIGEIKGKKKQETFLKEIDKICDKCAYAYHSKKYIKIFEHILEFSAEDAENKEKGSEFVNWEKPENLFK